MIIGIDFSKFAMTVKSMSPNGLRSDVPQILNMHPYYA
jgi:hypothetical protein